MDQVKEKYMIIRTLKNLVKKTGSVFFRKPRDYGITEEIARKIQKSAYELSQKKEKDTYTPPYKEIAEQLQVQDDQIFRAAVFNLVRIAANEDKNAPAIISILETHAVDGKHTTDQQAYLRSKIEEIKKIRSSK